MGHDVATNGSNALQHQLSALRARYLGDARIAKGLSFTFALEITLASAAAQPNRWVFCPGPPASVEEGLGYAEVNVVLREETLIRVLSGASNPQVEYLKGNIRLEGNVELALRLAPLLSSCLQTA